MNEPCPADLTGNQNHPKQTEPLWQDLCRCKGAIQAFLARLERFPTLHCELSLRMGSELEAMKREAARS